MLQNVNSFLNLHQSGFIKHHSTKTLIVSLYNKLVSAATCLCLLDISAAFDTIDHDHYFFIILPPCSTTSLSLIPSHYLSQGLQTIHMLHCTLTIYP